MFISVLLYFFLCSLFSCSDVCSVLFFLFVLFVLLDPLLCCLLFSLLLLCFFPPSSVLLYSLCSLVLLSLPSLSGLAPGLLGSHYPFTVSVYIRPLTHSDFTSWNVCVCDRTTASNRTCRFLCVCSNILLCVRSRREVLSAERKPALHPQQAGERGRERRDLCLCSVT